MVMVKRGKARKGNIHSLGTEIVFTVLEAGAYLFNLATAKIGSAPKWSDQNLILVLD